MGTYSYKNAITFFLIFAIILFNVLVGFMTRYIPKYGLLVFILFIIISVVSGFFLVVYFKEKYFKDQRAQKRKRALIKVGGHIKRSTSVMGNYTIYNSQTTVRFFADSQTIKIYGHQRGFNDEAVISAKSDIPYLIDNVWDYICMSFDRTSSLAFVFNICRLNCLDIKIENVNEEDTKNILKLINDECDRESTIEFSYSKKEFNNLTSKELMAIEGMEQTYVDSIFEYKKKYGPICSMALLTNKFNIPESVIKANPQYFELPITLIERYKFEQAFNLVDV